MKPLVELLYKMADDALIMGHRNSEWTGLGPTIEEDISFSSMAQDKIGHALALYELLHTELDEPDPETIAYSRSVSDLKSCHLVEIPISEYDVDLMRNFFYNHAEYCRYSMLKKSSFEPLAKLSRKIWGEIKYHIFHGNTWVKQLGNGTEESRARMQTALNDTFPYALGIFEKGIDDKSLATDGIFDGEQDLWYNWMESISPIIEQASLLLPEPGSIKPILGGRQGKHSEYLQPLLTEMREVYDFEPGASW